MTEHLQVLHLNVGKQRQAQWSMLNDKSLSKYAMLAVVEPHLYEDSGTGSAQCGTHRQWQPLTPSVHRQDSHARYAYRAMLWVNTGIQAIQVPIPSYDIAAATIETAGGTVLVISAYDSDEGEGVAERDRKLHSKLAFIRQAIDDTRRARGEDLEVLLCADFNRHDALWGAAEDILRYRRDEGVRIIHLAHEYSLPIHASHRDQHLGTPRWTSTIDGGHRPRQLWTRCTGGPLLGARKRPRVRSPADSY